MFQSTSVNKDILSFSKKVHSCKKCKRLVSFREKVSREKRKSYQDQKYWNKPVAGFGDINAKVVMIGLAPAAHGATRTGRVFTGDKSSDFLFNCLHKSGFSNQPTSNHIRDGLKLKNLYITLALKCVPPQDKPTAVELKNCSNFFEQELNLLKSKKTIVALGKIAFDACIRFFKDNHNIIGSFKFGHGAKYKINGINLIGCYHPSPRNVNTGRIDVKKMTALFKSIQKLSK